MNKLLVIFISFIMVSCTSSTGSKFLAHTSENQLSQKLISHHTTKHQVRAQFGDPQNVEFLPNGHEEWDYAYTKSKAKTINFVPVVNTLYSGSNDNVRKLKILFNAQGIVEKYSFVNNKGETLRGALSD